MTGILFAMVGGVVGGIIGMLLWEVILSAFVRGDEP